MSYVVQCIRALQCSITVSQQGNNDTSVASMLNNLGSDLRYYTDASAYNVTPGLCTQPSYVIENILIVGRNDYTI